MVTTVPSSWLRKGHVHIGKGNAGTYWGTMFRDNGQDPSLNSLLTNSLLGFPGPNPGGFYIYTPLCWKSLEYFPLWFWAYWYIYQKKTKQSILIPPSPISITKQSAILNIVLYWLTRSGTALYISWYRTMFGSGKVGGMGRGPMKQWGFWIKLEEID